MPLVVIGTKSDLENKRQVESYEGQMVAKQFNCPFLEVCSHSKSFSPGCAKKIRSLPSKCSLGFSDPRESIAK